MSITGGVKFFHKSMCLYKDGATAAASNGNDAASNAIDQNAYTYWYTVGSADSETDTLTITFASSKTISRILLLDHNFKQFTIKYLNGAGAYTAFTNVINSSGSLSGITETTLASSVGYYEFDAVTTSGIKISVTKTQIANAEKYLSQVIATSELGTLAGWPIIQQVTVDRNSRVRKTLSGKYSLIKADETASFSINFKSYPSAVAYNVDIDLMLSLHDLDDAFLVWLCGGKSSQFSYTLRGYRLLDVYQMQIVKAFQLAYTQSIYRNSLNCEVFLEEVI